MLVDVSQQPTLLASLNRSANPCHNFYRFVCDGWLARQGDRFSLLEELALTAQRDAATILRHIQVPAVGAISAVHKAALLMQKCLLSSRWPPTRSAAAVHGQCGTNVAPADHHEYVGSHQPHGPNVYKVSIKTGLFIQHWDLNVVFELELLPMPKRAGGRPRWVLSASTQLNSWRQERRRLGPEYLTRIRQYVEGFSDARVTRSLVDSIFEADDEMLRVTNVYNGGRESRTIDKLCEVAPEFQTSSQRTLAWLDAMNGVTQPYYEVNGSDVISVSNVRFLAALQRLLQSLNVQKPRVVPMYLSWYTLRTLGWTVAPNTPEWQQSSGSEQQQRYFGTVHQVMPLAAAKPYADAASWDRGLIEELFEASKRSYRKRIDRSTWMDEATRQFARDKIRSVNGVVPVPGLIWNASALERIYECVSRGRELSSLPYLLETRRCKERLLLSVAGSGQSSPETITWTSPTAYLVRYLDVYNSAVLMGSVLYPPVLQTSGDHRDVFNCAGLVFLFSKLLYGAVGQRGSLRDSVGTLRPWWSNATHEGFSRVARCFEDLYQFDARFIDDDIGAAVAVTVAFAAYERRLRDLYALHSAGLWRIGRTLSTTCEGL
ncbi:endothelin-converting enzyme 1 [Rhipicephalus microplus]|uniref:endothelin-converting enzyme 1 n=1 Tax=Rhipicephalus microplus TaxID=6941 RepID=UPI003F6D756D